VTCTLAKEFLGEHGISYRSVIPLEGEDARRRWLEVGRPPLPSVSVDGRVTYVVHVSQLYSLLGVEGRKLDEGRLAWDLVELERMWHDLVAPLDWEAVVLPTPARNRTVRDLVVNTFEFIPAVIAARDTTVWEMVPEPPELAAGFSDVEGLAGYMRARIAETESFAFEHYGFDHPEPGPTVSVSQPAAGDAFDPVDLPYATVLAWTCNHTAGHLRQVDAFLTSLGVAHTQTSLSSFDHLLLAEDPFGDGADALDPLALHRLFATE
jgi:hypothetical protein